MLVVNRFSSVNYGGRPIQIHDPASDSDLNAVWTYLQSKIDQSLGPIWTTWKDLNRKNPKTVEFLKNHTRIGRKKHYSTAVGPSNIMYPVVPVVGPNTVGP